MFFCYSSHTRKEPKKETEKSFPSLKHLIERARVREISEEIFIDTGESGKNGKIPKQQFVRFLFFSQTPHFHVVPLHPLHRYFCNLCPKKSVHIPETTQLFCCCERSGLFTFDAFCYNKNNNIKVCFCMRVFRYYFLCDFYCLVYKLVLRCCVY